MNFDLLPECYADTLMVQMMGYERPNHCHSIGDVANTMRQKFNNRTAIGFIDKDKPGTIPSYISEFDLLLSSNNVELCWHSESKHFIIIVAPALEQWLLETAEDLSIDTSQYGFKNLKQLRNLTKSQHVNQNNNLKQFFNTLNQKKNSPLKEIKSWVDTIREKQGKIAAIKRALGLEDA